ncbi:aspartate/glutamate racemase family protein [Paracoccus sp. 1_MG-2023]|uniref:aspartate/glutamate racemase family protein n=1 Tax=unclassified Paracoccus (in: a-proteobacteria) TaxID=2688777 RepID=UPI001C080E2D|nr:MULTISPECIES: aspartate/glutamate racemase family protein [unclassified Paracoccus (in: a-proteobacteria)]MBU2959123.1 aspartate/glutamate racemase family protein [Paracoccus sp. C2R09]MDO6669407.1 aspartate/glutamate racemase family protein [Paracoccus sp. 1_MG-2023]
MRLHVVNPNASEAMTAGIAASARRAVMPGIDLIVTGAAGGPLSIEGPVDGARAVPWMLERIEDAEREGVDGHVIACFDDTGLDAARCLAGSPVVGIGEAAAHLASLVADRFAVVTSVPEALPVLRGNLVRYGLATRCAGLRAADIQVLDIDAGTPAAVAAIRREVSAALKQDGADAIMLGCAGMAPLAASLSEEFRCPVIEGIAAGLSLVSALAGAGLRTSKRGAYASPRAKVAR